LSRLVVHSDGVSPGLADHEWISGMGLGNGERRPDDVGEIGGAVETRVAAAREIKEVSNRRSSPAATYRRRNRRIGPTGGQRIGTRTGQEGRGWRRAAPAGRGHRRYRQTL